ncbi:MAG: hypothetical protein ACFFA3_14800 [Promethearchaeota archaeon]
MPNIIDSNMIIKLSKGEFTNQIQNILEFLISDISDYLRLKPINKKIVFNLLSNKMDENKIKNSILDWGVNRLYNKDVLIINIYEMEKFYLPFIFLREALYCFIPTEIKNNKTIKIFINQIVENELEKASGFKKWHNLIRDVIVDRDFLISQLDQLKKFFKMESHEIHESPIQFFFMDIHENATVMGVSSVSSYYNEIFEKYTTKTSKSLYNKEIIKTIIFLLKIFYENKNYLSSTDYLGLYKHLKETKTIEPYLSSRKFYENLQWINNCTSIAPSYNIVYTTIGISPVICELTFNPIIPKFKIKKLLGNFPFMTHPRIIENSFACKIVINLHAPSIYLKDILSYLNKLYLKGYLISKNFLLYKTVKNSLNFNYFTDEIYSKTFVNPSIKGYRKNYEIEHLTEFPINPLIYPLSILEYVILFRIRNFSVTGLTFDKRRETLNAIKEEVENEYRKQQGYINSFKKNFTKLFESKQTKKEFLEFLEQNQKFGIFVLLEKISSILNLSVSIEKILGENLNFNNINQLELHIKKSGTINLLEENLILRDKYAHKVLFNDILPLSFKSGELYRKEIEKIKFYHDIINSCFNLKILSLKAIKIIIEDRKILMKILRRKEEMNKRAFKSFKSYQITNEKIESIIHKFLFNNPPVIVPMLLNTIMTSQFAKFYPEIFLLENNEVRTKANNLKSYFPRLFIQEAINQDTSENIIHVIPYSVNIQEKRDFITSIHNLFGENLIAIRRNYWRGLIRISNISAKDFYDFEKRQFFHTKELFEQFFNYTQNLLGDKELGFHKNVKKYRNFKLFWSVESSMNQLVNNVRKRVSRQINIFDQKLLNQFIEFRSQLDSYLINGSRFNDAKLSKFFATYINSINFIPALRKFGYAQYFMYFLPHNWDDIDLKLLILNSFQTIKYPAQIDQEQPILIKYLFPYRKPNKSYLNWLLKSKKAIREYCFFFIKKFFEITHFNHSLSLSGWQYSSNRFKNYVQNILFNPNYITPDQDIREFNIEQFSTIEEFGLGTSEFKDLTKIYNWRSIDIKSYLGTNNHSIIKIIESFIKKGLIFPYVSMKNLDLQDKVTLILPNVETDKKNQIFMIFCFFNICRIYEIEGEYYFHGFEKSRAFESGFMIEIWFPKCELDEFFDVFDLLFEYLEIKHYLILTDLVKGETLLKNIYGDLEFLRSYNPLLNLKWNKKDKIWMNHKLFTKDFEPIYPNLIPKD